MDDKSLEAFLWIKNIIIFSIILLFLCMSTSAKYYRNPNQILGKLQSMIDPKMMAQLGGAGNLMSMMKEMSTNPDMQKMMSSMGGDM